MKQISEESKLFVIYAVLSLSTLAVFWPVHNFQFVNFDDHVYVTENQYVSSGLTWQGAAWAFTTGHSSNWHPLTWLSHMLDCQLFNSDAGWHHVTNLIFHIINVLLLFTVFRQMTGAIWQSAFIAAAFALHPLHVESVAWVSERKDVLSTFFWILTMWAYLYYVKNPNVKKYLIVILLFACGLMSKPMLVTLPFALLLLDYWPLDRFKKKSFYRLLREKIPLLILSAASCVVTCIVQRSGGALESTEAIPLNFRMANAFVSYAKYMLKSIWPAKLAFFYPHPGPDIQSWQAIISLLFLLAISIWIISKFRVSRYLFVGWFWFLGSLVPVIGFVQVGAQAMADRYTYVPLIGLFIIVAWGIPDLFAKLKHRQHVIILSASVVLSALVVCSWFQVQYWRDSVSLFEHALKVTEKNYTAHSCLAYVLLEQGKIDRAIAHNRSAIAFDPTYLDAQYNLGCIYMQQNNLSEAMKQFYNVLQIKPDYIKAHRNIAKILVRQDKPLEAISHYENILKSQPSDYDAQNGIGIALARINRLDEAVEHFNRAIRINAKIADAQSNLGFTLVRQGKFDEAGLHLAEAVRLDPNNAKTHYQLARVLSEKGKLDETIVHLKDALRLEPNYVEPMNNLAWYLVANKDATFFDPNEAVRVASRACELTNYQDPAMMDTLALAYWAAGKSKQAIDIAEKALNIAQAKNNTQAIPRIQEHLNSFRKTPLKSK